MKKRILAVFLVVAVILPLAACVKGERTSETELTFNIKDTEGNIIAKPVISVEF